MIPFKFPIRAYKLSLLLSGTPFLLSSFRISKFFGSKISLLDKKIIIEGKEGVREEESERME